MQGQGQEYGFVPDSVQKRLHFRGADLHQSQEQKIVDVALLQKNVKFSWC